MFWGPIGNMIFHLQQLPCFMLPDKAHDVWDRFFQEDPSSRRTRLCWYNPIALRRFSFLMAFPMITLCSTRKCSKWILRSTKTMKLWLLMCCVVGWGLGGHFNLNSFLKFYLLLDFDKESNSQVRLTRYEKSRKTITMCRIIKVRNVTWRGVCRMGEVWQRMHNY